MNFDRNKGIHTLRLKFDTPVSTAVEIFTLMELCRDVIHCRREFGKFFVYFSEDQYLLGNTLAVTNEVELIVSPHFIQICLNGNNWLKFQNVPLKIKYLYPPNTFLKDGHPNLKVDDDEDYEIVYNKSLKCCLVNFIWDYE